MPIDLPTTLDYPTREYHQVGASTLHDLRPDPASYGSSLSPRSTSAIEASSRSLEPGLVTVTQEYTGASSINSPLTTTISPSAGASGTVLIQTPPVGRPTPAVSTYTSNGFTYATTYAATAASSGQRTTTELDPAVTGLRTTIIGGSVIVLQPPYTTIYQQYTGTLDLASASTVTTIPADFDRDVQGTVFAKMLTQLDKLSIYLRNRNFEKIPWFPHCPICNVTISRGMWIIYIGLGWWHKD